MGGEFWAKNTKITTRQKPYKFGKIPFVWPFCPVEPAVQTHEEVSCRIRIYGLMNRFECGKSVLFRTGVTARGS